MSFHLSGQTGLFLAVQKFLQLKVKYATFEDGVFMDNSFFLNPDFLYIDKVEQIVNSILLNSKKLNIYNQL